MSTANWNGYTAYWEIKDKHLYLQKVTVELYGNDGKRHVVEVPGIEQVFARFLTEDGILASWVSNQIRLGRGKLVRYMHSGFERDMEEECLLTLKSGAVTKRQIYNTLKR